MKYRFKRTVCLVVCCLVASVPLIADEPHPDTTKGAQLFEGLGDYHREFTTTSDEAQRYLDQGMVWLQAFNYDEAERSFREAARLDPECAMAWWGVAYAAAPSYNHAQLDERRAGIFFEALQNAQARIENASPVERALIEALGKRGEMPYPMEDDSHLDQAYADAMAEVWERFPEDADVGVLYAEALMVRTPWALYNIDREPAEDTPMIEALLERVLELNPNQAGAAHLYIHAVELSKSPERGLVVADRLSTLVPLSGHLLHMPSHIYTRTGDWDRAIEQNALAMEADVKYRAKSPDQFVQHMYMVHNNHIRAYGAMMVGREAEALEASRRMWSQIPEDLLEDVAPQVDAWMCSVYDVYKRFGRWDKMLAEPAPPEYMPFTLATWHAHRAISYAAKKDIEGAQREFRAYRRVRDDTLPRNLPEDYSLKAAKGRLRVIDHFVPGEIALQKGKYKKAIRHLEKAKIAEDKLGYSGEPPDYLQPIRHTLGAVYLLAGRLEEAEEAYREDLAEFPENGWSLYGLSRVLHAQGRTAEAAQVEEEFRLAWADADGPIETSCECIPAL
ncbi:MAG: tetratricopeptide repeat protein [Acidobacteria bacterium]|nr:tetratricopeptide repeat protein [Acidobacteriota bacterium]NIM60945.1 tetratricopeptide repeat protein [Acidobacteriota bacterium]NIO58013.1 tetratricopeptide repeat protein [Acidobacteriota bacterium]NIQ29020.1 tetratricopeptide repeat protein [Acidobacteriota bacterium]NIQ83544.1 tetratricopeptide repeat protein [Acidobacteriota bacterium]